MTTTLYSLAMESKFTEVFNRVRTHPEEAKFRNDNNWVTLHILIWKKAPLSTVKSVYKAYPPGLQLRSKRGETPLDMAESNNADERIIAFLKASEHAQMRDSVLQLSQLQSRFDGIMEETGSIKKCCDNLMEENENLRDFSSSVKESFDTLKASNELLKNGYESLAQQNQSMKEILQDLKKDLDSSVQENNSLIETSNKDRELLESEILTLKGEVTNLTNRNDIIIKDYDELKEQNKVLKDENEVLKLDWSLLKAQSDTMKNEIESIGAANGAVADENAVLTKESEVLKKTVASLLGTCNYLSQDNEALKDACNEIRRRSDANAFSFKDTLKAIESKISKMDDAFVESREQSGKRDTFVSALVTLVNEFDKDGKNGDSGIKKLLPGSPQSTACDPSM